MGRGFVENTGQTGDAVIRTSVGLEASTRWRTMGWQAGSLLVPAILVWAFIVPAETLIWQCGLRIAASLALMLLTASCGRPRWPAVIAVFSLSISGYLLASRLMHVHATTNWLMAAGLLDIFIALAILRLTFQLECPRSTRYLIATAGVFLLWSFAANSLHTFDQPSDVVQRFQPHVTADVLAQSQWLAVLQVHGYVLAMLLVFAYCIACGETRLLAITLATSAGVLACAVIYQHLAGEYSYLLQNSAVGTANMGRVRVGFRDHHSVTTVMGITLLAVLSWSFVSGRRFAACLPLVILLAVAVTLNSTRSATLTLLATIPVAVALSQRRRWLPAIAVAAGLYLAVGAEHLLYKKSLAGIEEDASITEVATTNAPRMMLAVRASEQVGKTWLSGAGFGRNFFELKSQDFWGYRFTNSGHMLPLDIALGAGVFGGLLFLLFLGATLAVGLWEVFLSWRSRQVVPRHGRLLAAAMALLATLLLSAFNTVEGGIGLDLGFLWAGYLLVGSRGGQTLSQPSWNRVSQFIQHRRTEIGFAAAVFAVVGVSCLFHLSREGRYYGLVHISLIDVVKNPKTPGLQPTIYVNSSRGLEEIHRYWPADAEPVRLVLIDSQKETLDLPPGALVVWDAICNRDFSRQIAKLGYGQHVYFDWRSPVAFPEHWRLSSAYHSQRGLDVYRIEERLTDCVIRPGTIKIRSPSTLDGDVRLAVDGSMKTYWDGGENLPVTVELELSDAAMLAPVVWYSITSSDQFSREHDPRGWRLEGSNDARDWFLLDERDNIAFMGFKERQSFRTKSPATCRFVRLRFDRVNEEGQTLHLGELDVRARLASIQTAGKTSDQNGH